MEHSWQGLNQAGKAAILLLNNQMTKESDFVRITVSRQETKEPVFQEVKVVYPEGYKTLWGYQKHQKQIGGNLRS